MSPPWWQRHALILTTAITAAWAAVVILLDVVVLALQGRNATISWQLRCVSLCHRVIPGAAGFVQWGLAMHFWCLHGEPLWQRQPIHDWFLGGLIGAVFVYLFWLQRP